MIFRSVCRCRGCSLFPRSLNYRLVVLLLRITVVTCDRTGTIVDIRKDAGGYPNASHARRLNRLGSQFSVFYSSNVYGWLFLRAVDDRIDSVGVDYCFSSYRLIQWMDRSLLHKCSLTLQVLRLFVQFNSSSLIIIYWMLYYNVTSSWLAEEILMVCSDIVRDL